MSRFRKKRTHPTVSLFPFLAVLICTLGVLIIMLVLAVKSADVAAAKKLDESNQAAADELEAAQQVLELERYRAEAIQDLRKNVVERLSRSRKNRSYLQDDVRKTEKLLENAIEQLTAMEAAIANAQSQALNPVDQKKLDRIAASIEAKKMKITEAEEKLAVEKDKSKQTGPARYSLLPFRGAGGTFRRPIYVECLANEIRLQPLNISIKKADFVLPIRAGNPLDAALLSIQEYWQQSDVAGEQGSPYPLLVVRPDGAETFVLARRAMKSWTDEFGYELVDEKKELNYGTTDPALAQRINELVGRIKSEQYQVAIQQRQLEQHLAQFSSGRPRRGLSASNRNGGFVATSPGRNSIAQTSFQSSGNGNSANRTWQSSNQSTAGQKASKQDNQFSRTAANDRQNSRNPNQDFSKGNQNKSSSASGNAQSNSTGNPTESDSRGPSNGPSSFGSSAPSDSLAAKRGDGWALPSKTAGGTGYLRPITVFCNDNSLRLRTASGDWRTIPFSKSSESAIDKMVDEIWKRIDSWGIAGQGSFWKPQLRVVTEKGGEKRFSEVQTLLQNSGLIVERTQSR
jgi:hypothetical protein